MISKRASAARTAIPNSSFLILHKRFQCLGALLIAEGVQRYVQPFLPQLPEKLGGGQGR